jgi:hypothetical protein
MKAANSDVLDQIQRKYLEHVQNETTKRRLLDAIAHQVVSP